jgi:hypothetical protein
VSIDPKFIIVRGATFHQVPFSTVYRGVLAGETYDLIAVFTMNGEEWFGDHHGEPSSQRPTREWRPTADAALHAAASRRMNHLWKKVADLEAEATCIRKQAEAIGEAL